MNYTCQQPKVGGTLSRSCGSCDPCRSVQAEVALAIATGASAASVAKLTGRPPSAVYLLFYRQRRNNGTPARQRVIDLSTEDDEADYTLRPDQCERCFLSGDHECIGAPSLQGSSMAEFQGAVKW